MKKFTLIIVLLLSVNILFAQSTATLSLPNVEVTNPGEIAIPLKLNAISANLINGIQISFYFDVTKIQWMGTTADPAAGISFINPAFTPLGADWLWNYNTSTGNLIFLWQDPTYNGVSISPPSDLITFRFQYLGGLIPGTSSPIAFSLTLKTKDENNKEKIVNEIYDENFEIYQLTLINGSVFSYCCLPSSTLNAKMFLEGPYFNSQMTPFLNLFGYIPLDQPYNTAPWNYDGTETVTEIPNANVVDWVLVQLLSRHTGSVEYMFQVEAQKAAFLLKNGDIKALDGTSSLQFNNVDASDLYLRIQHRNHLDLISPAPLTGTNNIYSYDFTAGPHKNIGGAIVQKQLSTVIWGAKAADGNANKQIDNKDKDEVWLIEKEQTGYRKGDYNMNSQVDNDDKVLKWKPNAGNGLPPVKDTITINQPPVAPSIPQPTDGAIDQPINATISWTCTDPENDPLTYDVYFGTTNPPVIAVSGQTGNTYNPGALNYNTQYFWKIVAHDDHSNNTEGPIWSFTTIASGTWQCGNPLIDSRDNQSYTTVQIGTQCWMAENLNIGTRIDGYGEQTDNAILEKYCYDDLETNCEVYGGLYQWNEMMQYVTTEGVQGICPTGWHVPTDAEYCTLTTFIDATVDCNINGWSGTDVGTKMKSTTGWNSGGNGTNTSGFTALPGGYRNYDGNFFGMGYNAYFWSSTEDGTNYAWGRHLDYDYAYVYTDDGSKYYGFSVRCLKDTPPTWSCGDVFNDTRDNQTYNTVQIGTQCWMAENLNIGTRVDGVVTQTDNTILEKYCYDDLDINCDTYGGLYQWDEMMEYVTTEGTQGICPTGWHLPTNMEYTNLTDYLGGEYIAGGKMKTTGTIEDGTGLWLAPNTGATNESGFSSLPGGRYGGDGYGYGYIGGYPYYWSSSEGNAELAWFRQLAYLDATVYYGLPYKSYGFSVRCIKDTPPTWSCGDVLNDTRDNQTYNTVQIGTQCWMAENLNIGTRIDGVVTQTDNTIVEKYCYNNEETNCDTYGGLYQWDEMMQYLTTEGAQGICPIGWHLPTDTEWTTLITFLGGESIAGGNMKTTGTIEAGTGLWYAPNTGATNESGFSALPGGYRYYDGYFYGMGFTADFWSSTKYGTDRAWYRYLYDYLADVSTFDDYKYVGFSSRCVQD